MKESRLYPQILLLLVLTLASGCNNNARGRLDGIANGSDGSYQNNTPPIPSPSAPIFSGITSIDSKTDSTAT